MPKRILIIKACGVTGEDQECNNIQTQAEMYGIETDLIAPTNINELVTGLQSGKKYDYVYLSSHGNDEGLCNHNRTLDISWFDFGVMLCSSMCMNYDCILMLSCCRGGLNQVAYDLLYCCPKIAYIVGPRQSLPAHDMLICFNVLLYNLTHRGLDPIVSCEKIKAGTDIRFVCFDKLEVETETSYLLRVSNFERRMNEQLNAARQTANEPLVPLTEPQTNGEAR
jgi:hypothetical protein